MRGVFVLASMGLALFVTEGAASSSDVIPGPVRGQVIHVTDGDTVLVMVEAWPLTFHRVAIRIADVDAPETRGGCAASKALADEAQEFLAALLGLRTGDSGLDAIGAPLITLRNIRPGKFAGRMVAEMYTADGVNVGERLVAEGYAKPWDGEGDRPGWC